MATALELTCPACGIDFVQHIHGDIRGAVNSPLVCLGCRALLTVDFLFPGNTVEETWRAVVRGATMKPFARYPTDEEERVFLSDARVLAAINNVAAYHKQHGPPMTDPPDGESRESP